MNAQISSHEPVTASRLYNYMKCPHRVWRDLFGPQDERIAETNPFLQLLWDRGVLHERKVVECLGDFEDVSEGSFQARFDRTLAAMKRGVQQIYQGVLICDNLLGIPDLLRLEESGNYVPIEIKSGRGYEGADEESEGRPKKSYAVQLALYVDLLERLGFSHERVGEVIDINSNQVSYGLGQHIGPKTPMTFWELYEQTKGEVEALVLGKARNTPALCGDCKLCAWHDSCLKWIQETDDLTGIFYLGRSRRDTIIADTGIDTIEAAVGLDVNALAETKKKNKTFLRGIGPATMEQIQRRANILKHVKAPVLHAPLEIPQTSIEVFFDIEDDPTQDFVYLHGVLERTQAGNRYLSFVARERTEESEKEAWSAFWQYIDALPADDYSVFYYAPHEKTMYRAMQKKYPDLISIDKVDSFFEKKNVVDLYTDVVARHTDWPVSSYSIKALASFLGFSWRDETPSGALSIQWFNEYLGNKDEALLKRILEYNEDDCRATMVLKDMLCEMNRTLVGSQ